MALVLANYAFREMFLISLIFVNFCCCNLVLQNQTGKGGLYQHVLALCAIVDKGNIEETIFRNLVVYLIIIMMKKKFNKHSSHDQHGSKRSKLVQHIHSCLSHAFTHTSAVTTTLCKAPAQLLQIEESDLYLLLLYIFVLPRLVLLRLVLVNKPAWCLNK